MLKKKVFNLCRTNTAEVIPGSFLQFHLNVICIFQEEKDSVCENEKQFPFVVKLRLVYTLKKANKI